MPDDVGEVMRRAMEMYTTYMTNTLSEIAKANPAFFEQGISALLQPNEPPEVRKAFLAALEAAPTPEAWAALIEQREMQVGLQKTVQNITRGMQ